MRFPNLALALLAGATSAAYAAAGSARTVAIYIQPLASPDEAEQPPIFLAELAIPDFSSPQNSASSAPSADDAQPSSPSSASSQQHTYPAEILSYEAPDLSSFPPTRLVRTGVYDPSAKRWTSATTVAAAANFGEKGRAPRFLLTVEEGDGGNSGEVTVLSVACRGVAIDAGYTRDFGPRAEVVVTAAGAQPVLNRPVVVGPGGGRGLVEEKTFLQKYWWALAIGALLLFTGGGEQK